MGRVWICAVLVAMASCRRATSADGISITSDITPKPVLVGTATVHVKVMDGLHPVSNALVELEGDMSHPGMAPAFGNAKALGSGEYEGLLNLNMPGDWVVMIHVKLLDGRKLEREVPLHGVEESQKSHAIP